MKFFALIHPTMGYLTSNNYYCGSWSPDVNKAKKWSRASHVKSLQTQTTRDTRKECSIVQLEFFIDPIITILI